MRKTSTKYGSHPQRAVLLRRSCVREANVSVLLVAGLDAFFSGEAFLRAVDSPVRRRAPSESRQTNAYPGRPRGHNQKDAGRDWRRAHDPESADSFSATTTALPSRRRRNSPWFSGPRRKRGRCRVGWQDSRRQTRTSARAFSKLDPRTASPFSEGQVGFASMGCCSDAAS